MAALFATAQFSALTMNPIRLDIEESPSAVTVRVIGAPEQAFTGSFSLETSGDGNHSTHRSSVSLNAGETVTLSNVTLTGVGQWKALLRVTPESGAPYEELASGNS